MESEISTNHAAGSELKTFEDLIFCPLALSPVPQINIPQFLEWMEAAREHDKQLTRFESAEKMGQKGFGDYPWLTAFAISPVTNAKQNPWIAGFDQLFPELVRHVRQYPFKRLEACTFIAQKESKEVFLHTDRDRWWGMRFYLENTHGEKLYFRKTRGRLHSRPQTWEKDAATGELKLKKWEELCETERHYAKVPEPRCSFMLNSVRAAHGVEKSEQALGSKITCLMVGEYDESALAQLLERSAHKYENNCIWY